MNLLISTVSRSDFGILSNLVKNLKNKKKYKIKIIATGEHYSVKMGNTYQEISNQKIFIDNKIKLKEYNSSPLSVLKKSSEIIFKLSNYLKRYKPDLLIILGDKYETLMVAYCAFINKIPIAHIHGGEKTVGSLDDTFRHQISKMSNIHYVEKKVYKKRLIQLGETAENIIVCGSLSKESLKNHDFHKREVIAKKFKINFLKKNMIFTYHPETVTKINKKKINEIFSIFKNNPEIMFIVTAPNLDIGSDYLRALIKKKKKLKNVKYIKSFGQDYYFSILNIVDGIIGNSSSGIIEAPALKKFTINIGKRQTGRFFEKTVINCLDNIKDIEKAIKFAYSNKFRLIQKNLKIKDNLTASKIIEKSIRNFNFKHHKYKVFKDIKFNY